MMEIIDKVREHHNSAIRSHDRVLFTGLYGSQNYKTDLPTSDVDTKVIILPSFYSMVFGTANTVRERHMDDGSISNVMDLVSFSRNIMKGSINFVEILFTDYFLVEEDGVEIWAWLRNNREALVRINPNGTLHACMGHIMRNFKEFQKHNENEAKAVSNIARLASFMELYASGKTTYKECLTGGSFYWKDIRTRYGETDTTCLISTAMEAAAQYVNIYKDVEPDEELVDELNNRIYQTYRELVV